MSELEVVNPLNKLYYILDSIINTIPDINYRRANEVDTKDRRWVFPTYPEKNDENYPRASITFNRISVSEYGAGQYVQQIEDVNDEVIKEQFGQYLTVDVSTSIFVKKDQGHTVVYDDGSTHLIKNENQCDYMSYKILNAIRQNRYKFIEQNFDIIGELNITPAYDDNHFLFAATVDFKVITLSVWNINYPIGSTIEIINYIPTVEQV